MNAYLSIYVWKYALGLGTLFPALQLGLWCDAKEFEIVGSAKQSSCLKISLILLSGFWMHLV